MKFYLLAATALACASSSIMSMLPELPPMKDCKKLTFLLGTKHEIVAYAIKTKIKAPVNDLKGQNLFTLSPIANSWVPDHIQQAQLQSSTIRAIVKLEDKEFLSKVSPVVVTGYGLPHKLLTLKSLEDL